MVAPACDILPIMKRLSVSLLVFAVACSKQAPPAEPMVAQGDVTPTQSAGDAAPAQGAADAQAPPGEDAAPAQGAADAQAPSGADATPSQGTGNACERGDKVGCASLAQGRIARYDRL